jgi:hypothetical protein
MLFKNSRSEGKLFTVRWIVDGCLVFPAVMVVDLFAYVAFYHSIFAAWSMVYVYRCDDVTLVLVRVCHVVGRLPHIWSGSTGLRAHTCMFTFVMMCHVCRSACGDGGGHAWVLKHLLSCTAGSAGCVCVYGRLCVHRVIRCFSTFVCVMMCLASGLKSCGAPCRTAVPHIICLAQGARFAVGRLRPPPSSEGGGYTVRLWLRSFPFWAQLG